MNYMKHRYSKRIYQVMEDHGPEHPYLWSPWEFAVRNPTPLQWEKFFAPCEKPPEMPRSYPISIPQEIEWEKKQFRKNEPIVVHPPVPTKKAQPGEKTSRPRPSGDSSGYTLADLCGEVNIPQSKARALLRKSKLKKPLDGWKWPSREEAKPYLKFLRKQAP